MRRYFIEVAYIGTQYSGFQIQQNATTIQGEIEKALLVIFKQPLKLTGSSRTDAGVHAKQNYFHVDIDEDFVPNKLKEFDAYIYNLNALLPNDIVIKNIREVNGEAHSRFSAATRSYIYNISIVKDPFNVSTSYYFPYKMDINLLNEAAAIIKEHLDFEAFSKKHTQVNNFNCTISESIWCQTEDKQGLLYFVTANRFLRGMVKALTGTMLKIGTGHLSIQDLSSIFNERKHNLVDFSPPGKGLMLVGVKYPADIFVDD